MLSVKNVRKYVKTNHGMLTVLGDDGLDVEDDHVHMADSKGVRDELTNARRPCTKTSNIIYTKDCTTYRQ